MANKKRKDSKALSIAPKEPAIIVVPQIKVTFDKAISFLVTKQKINKSNNSISIH